MDATMQSIGATHTDAALPLSGANPHYANGPEYRNNSQRCIVANELRRRGYEVEAEPAVLNGNDDVAAPCRSPRASGACRRRSPSPIRRASTSRSRGVRVAILRRNAQRMSAADGLRNTPPG